MPPKDIALRKEEKLLQKKCIYMLTKNVIFDTKCILFIQTFILTFLQNVAHIRIFEYIREYSLQIIFIFILSVKKHMNNIHNHIRSRLGI